MSNLVLNGGVSNVKYIWHVESDKACEACQSLDGTEYIYEGDIPDRPHPNCRCYIEIVKNIENNQNQDQEPCDCWEQIQSIMDEVDEGCGDCEKLIEESLLANEIIQNFINNISNFKDYSIIELYDELVKLIEETLLQLYEICEEIVLTVQIFYNNWDDLRNLNIELGTYLDGSAEYYHTKANCQAAQLGKVGEKTAAILGYLREMGDFPKEVIWKGYDMYKAFNNSLYDLKINEQGRKLGRENPDKDINDILEKPKGLPQKYW